MMLKAHPINSMRVSETLDSKWLNPFFFGEYDHEKNTQRATVGLKIEKNAEKAE